MGLGPKCTIFTAPVVAAVAGACLLALGMSKQVQTPSGFVPLGSTYKSTGQACPDRHVGQIAEQRLEQPSISLVVASLAVFAGLAARRTYQRKQSQVVMNVRGGGGGRFQSFGFKNPESPGKRGCKPLVNRWFVKMDDDRMLRGMLSRNPGFKTAEGLEEVVKKQLFGKFFMNIMDKRIYSQPDDKTVPRYDDKCTDIGYENSRPNFRKIQPLVLGAKSFSLSDHRYENPNYMRRWIEPATFKKLEILDWEMPQEYPPVVNLRELVEGGMHLGQPTKRNHWKPSMFKYIYSSKDGNHIFDLVQTASCLNRACYYAMDAAKKGASFLFVGTKAPAREHIKAAAERVNMPYAADLYIQGTISNFGMIQNRLGLLKRLHEEKSQGAWAELELNQSDMMSTYNKLTKKYGGLWNYDKLPDIVVCVDENKEIPLIEECLALGVPVICLSDNDTNAKKIDLVVPGNASGSKSIGLFCQKIADAIVLGQTIRRNMEMNSPGDLPVFKPEWDPFIWNIDRWRKVRRQNRQQPWMKFTYGSFEKWQEIHPWGRVGDPVPYFKFEWNVRSRVPFAESLANARARDRD